MARRRELAPAYCRRCTCCPTGPKCRVHLDVDIAFAVESDQFTAIKELKGLFTCAIRLYADQWPILTMTSVESILGSMEEVPT